MYFVGIDISKYKHDCFIITEDGEVILHDFSFDNNHQGFSSFLSKLSSLDVQKGIRIGFEATSHYAFNLKLFLENHHYSFMELNPVLLNKYIKSQTLRKTKTDALDSRSIACFLMTVDYKPYPKSFYHIYSLKSLTRLRDTLVRQRSQYLVRLTNVMDHIFPEFKPFFKNRFSVTALYILNKYHSPEHISNMNTRSYDELRKRSRGKFSMASFIKLKELAKNTVGASNDIFISQLKSLLNLHAGLDSEISLIETNIISLITDMDKPVSTITGIGPISAAVIVSEFGDIKRFASPAKMLSFAGLEPGYFQSGASEHHGHMVKRGSSQLRYALMNCCLPLIVHNMVFAEYYHKKRKEGKPHRVALSHVAKKLIRVIYALETKDIAFDPALLR